MRESGAEAVHPGYGFLAENAAFARACEDAGVVFIGPPADAIDAMGSKTRARELMQAAGVPIVPGTVEPVPDLETARRIVDDEIGYPVAVKAAGGGGGKGFRVALSEDELQAAFEGAAREGEKFFSDATVYLERYLPDPRHVEVQILADATRQHDPSRRARLLDPAPPPEARRGVAGAVVGRRRGAARADRQDRRRRCAGRRLPRRRDGRGPARAEREDLSGEYFFLEMNTRVQVEHCVTEMTTGIDIVKEGIRVAAGQPLSIAQEDVVLRGHAIECRINAEDASKRFAPAPGAIGAYVEPSGPGVRVDSGVRAGSVVSPMYDPMVAKLIVWDADREQATARMLRALAEFQIEGLKTLIPFHRALLASEQWARGETCRDLLEDKAWLKTLAFAPAKPKDDETRRERERRAQLRRRGVGPALRRARHRTAVRRRRRGRRRRGGPGQARPRDAGQARAQGRARHRLARVADAGQRLEAAGAASGRGRRGRRRRDHRGDEDGERDHRAQGRASSPSCRCPRATPCAAATCSPSSRTPMSAARAWLAQPDEAEAVAALLVAFRDHMGSGWPSENAFLASVERLFEDADAEFLLASRDDDSPPSGVLQLRFRFSVWKAAPDAWIEDLFVHADARRGGVGEALLALAIERARRARRQARRARHQRGQRRRARALRAQRLLDALEGRGGRDLFLGRSHRLSEHRMDLRAALFKLDGQPPTGAAGRRANRGRTMRTRDD